MGKVKNSYKNFTGRHIVGGRAGGNLVFADGHVAFFTRDQLWTTMMPPINGQADYNLPSQVIWDPIAFLNNVATN
jgi:prepilin-type processing-associated H-X9-DG protein